MTKKITKYQAPSTVEAVVPVVETAKVVSELYANIGRKGNEFVDAVRRFGAMLRNVEYMIGKCAGRGNEGEGVKGWLAKNCPEIEYKTAIRYKLLAERIAKGVGNERAAIAALQGNSSYEDEDGEVIDVPSEIVEKCDELVGHARSIRQLEQMMFDLFRDEAKAKGGRPKAEEKPLPKLSKKDEAKAIWNQFLQAAAKSSVKDSIPLLPAKETQIAYDDLNDLCKMLKEHLKEF